MKRKGKHHRVPSGKRVWVRMTDNSTFIDRFIEKKGGTMHVSRVSNVSIYRGAKSGNRSPQ